VFYDEPLYPALALPFGLEVERQEVVPLGESVGATGAPELWDQGITGAGVRVGVIDTGTSQSHEMISPGLKDTFSAVPGESVEDENHHGSWCCSAAAGRPVSTEHGELVGAAPGADLYALKALSNKGTGMMSYVMQAIEKAAVDFKCDVISMSLGSLFDNGGVDPVSKLVNDVVQKYNVLCVIAAGNSFIPLSIGSPGGAISAVTVGSYALRLPAAGIPSSFESKGPTTSLVIKPDTSAPGGNLLAPGIAEMILAAGAHESYQSMAGTSMATPQAAGEQLLAVSSFPAPKDTLRGYGPIRVDKMYGNLGKALPPISKLQAPLNVLQSTLYAPLTLIPRPENERLRAVRLPAIMGS
jgi:serine protease AprX